MSAVLLLGCSPAGRVGAGVSTLAIGTILAATPGETTENHPTCTPGPCNSFVDDLLTTQSTDHSGQVIGTALLLAGAALIISGAIAARNEQSMPMPMPAPAPIKSADAAFAADILATPPPAAQAPMAIADPAELVLRQRVENRLAIQASLAAKAGNCDAAIATANALAQRDPDLYVKLLMADPRLEACNDARAAAAQRM